MFKMYQKRFTSHNVYPLNKISRFSFHDRLRLFSAQLDGKEGYIYFLFEHKSYKPKDVALQLLKYILNILISIYHKQGMTDLPVILPVIIYHHMNNWNEPTILGEMIQGYEGFPM